MCPQKAQSAFESKKKKIMNKQIDATEKAFGMLSQKKHARVLIF